VEGCGIRDELNGLQNHHSRVRISPAPPHFLSTKTKCPQPFDLRALAGLFFFLALRKDFVFERLTVKVGSVD
jgi:hypothetical protein